MEHAFEEARKVMSKLRVQSFAISIAIRPVLLGAGERATHVFLRKRG